ncbi:MAG: deoxyguanosinetriphosphate triphosphohydrolase [Gammaproteobacteria bacterium]|nr:deoxyguanosinetriphosphate triphosphohydrolase [Gammaproteobacteria bacterium]MDE0303225.1 deoxyguanosinetriphosphate triphosphohydrolase [Gammaproteobacteria bacterium]
MAVDLLEARGGGSDQAGFAPYAASESNSLGRQHAEPPDEFRTLYQRDCDRIIHSAAFRSLEYKTQVMVNHADGSFRTRLTHSIEVAKLSRTLARALRLNEDLSESIALAHDLGHTPFGHAGQDALDDCMKEYGGFEHNLQSLRVIDKLEYKYADFRGLNLTFETREGVLKRCPKEIAKTLGPLGERFLKDGSPTLEAQLVDFADQIAYTNHDLDDGLRLGFLNLKEVRELALFSRAYDEAEKASPKLSRHALLHEANRRMITAMMVDLILATQKRIEQAQPDSPQAVRACPDRLAGFSDELRAELVPVTRLLHGKYYCHDHLAQATNKAVGVIRELFRAFMDRPQLLPTELHQQASEKKEARGEEGQARVIADYIASLSDRHILAEHRKIFDMTG